MKNCNEFSEYKKVSGIYLIFFNDDERVYVGSSNNLYRRLSRHFSELKNESHYNVHLQRFVSKYGLNNLQFKILETCEEADLIELENYYITAYDSIKKGFNMKLATGGGMSDESRERTRQIRLNSPLNTVVDMIQNEVVIDTGTINYLCSKYNLDSSSVYKILKGKRILHKEHTYRLTKQTDDKTIDSE